MNVPVRLHATTVSYDACFLVRLIRLVVPVERNGKSLLALANLAHEHGSRVAHICAEDLCADNENGHASRSTEAEIDLGLTE